MYKRHADRDGRVSPTRGSSTTVKQADIGKSVVAAIRETPDVRHRQASQRQLMRALLYGQLSDHAESRFDTAACCCRQSTSNRHA
jgi:hypothetical protein